MNNFSVYVLFSDSHQRIYIGMSENVQERLKQHNLGKTKSTKAFRPWRIIHIEYIGDRKNARNSEIFLKSGFGRQYLQQLYPFLKK